MRSEPRKGASSGAGAPGRDATAAGGGPPAPHSENAAPGLYVHVPFCRTKCPYCDFYSIIRGTPIERWLEALASEAARYGRDLGAIDFSETFGAFGSFDTLYLGGGTPSLLDGREIERLVGSLKNAFTFSEGIETTIEANPDDVTPRRVETWHALGINRVSLGVQSFNDAELRHLGRRHDAARAREAINLVRRAGFADLSLDFMYGIEEQTPADWECTLREAIRYSPAHLSCYQMTIKSATPFGEMLRVGSLQPPGEELQRELFMMTSELLQEHGYIHYEISSFARDESLLSRHNRKYWSRVPYLGLGPSAHSFCGAKRWWNVHSVESYCRLLERGERPIEDSETLGENEIALETLALGFRTREGVPLEALYRCPNGESLLERFEAESILRVADGRALPTIKGFCLADRVAVAFGR